MAEAPKNRRNLAVIGGGVGLAAAGVITLLVVNKPTVEETTDLAARAAAIPSVPNRPLEGGVVKPWEVKPPTAAELAELARADAAERDEVKAEKARAEEALKLAQLDAKSARQQAIEEARQPGILGTFQQGGAFASLTGTSGLDDASIYGGLIGTNPPDVATGWGRYGAIGGGRRRPVFPTITIGQATVKPTTGGSGELDKAIVRRYIKRNLAKLAYCYEKELLAKPTLAGGTVAATFTITDNGLVGSATASGVDATVARCMAKVIEGIEFPKPKGSGGVTANYPFVVRPPA